MGAASNELVQRRFGPSKTPAPSRSIPTGALDFAHFAVKKSRELQRQEGAGREREGDRPRYMRGRAPEVRRHFVQRPDDVGGVQAPPTIEKFEITRRRHPAVDAAVDGNAGSATPRRGPRPPTSARRRAAYGRVRSRPSSSRTPSHGSSERALKHVARLAKRLDPGKPPGRRRASRLSGSAVAAGPSATHVLWRRPSAHVGVEVPPRRVAASTRPVVRGRRVRVHEPGETSRVSKDGLERRADVLLVQTQGVPQIQEEGAVGVARNAS